MESNLKLIIISHLIEWLEEEYSDRIIDTNGLQVELDYCLSKNYGQVLIEHISKNKISREKAIKDIDSAKEKFFINLDNYELEVFYEKLKRIGISVGTELDDYDLDEDW